MSYKRTVYRCEFRRWGGEKSAVRSTEGIGAFCNGFWINANLELTKGDDSLYWIPPAAIIYIAKEEQGS